MISDFIKVGMRIDMVRENADITEPEESHVTYNSKVQDIFPNGDLEIDMPIQQNRLVLLHNGARYQMFFYSENGNYMAVGEIVNRYKTDNRYLLRVALRTQPEKNQRREYYRCDCMLNLRFHKVPEEDAKAENANELIEQYDLVDLVQSFGDGVAVDISGGGIRIISRTRLEPNSYIGLLFELPVLGDLKEFHVLGMIITSNPVKDTTTKFESRIQFVNISSTDREDIIRFIFEEERKARRLSRS